MITPVADDVVETGGLFRLTVRLMIPKGQSQDMRYVLSTARISHHRPIANCHSVQSSFEKLSDLLGEYFQIRDDYKNLTEEVCSYFLILVSVY